MALTDESNGTGMYMPVAPIGGSYRGRYEGSYARGRGRNARRDSMGRYSSEGYSRAAEDIADQMRSYAMNARDDRTRREVEQMADRMQTM